MRGVLLFDSDNTRAWDLREVAAAVDERQADASRTKLAIARAREPRRRPNWWKGH
jgi:hypothetical protein